MISLLSTAHMSPHESNFVITNSGTTGYNHQMYLLSDCRTQEPLETSWEPLQSVDPSYLRALRPSADQHVLVNFNDRTEDRRNIPCALLLFSPAGTCR